MLNDFFAIIHIGFPYRYNYEDDTWRRVDDRRLTFEDYNVALMPDLERLH